MKKTDTYAAGAERFHRCRGFAALRAISALSALLAGVFVCHAEPLSVAEPASNSVPVMKAWGDGVSRSSQEVPGLSLSDSQNRWLFLRKIGDRSYPWAPWRKVLIHEYDPFVPELDPHSEAISVPNAISDFSLELESIPSDDPVTDDFQPRNFPPEQSSQSIDFSGNTAALETPPAARAGASENGSALDLSVPGAVRGPSKVEFSSAGSERFGPDVPHDPGDSSGTGGNIISAPPGPVPAILPEPDVTALMGISALFFVVRGKLRKR